MDGGDPTVLHPKVENCVTAHIAFRSLFLLSIYFQIDSTAFDKVTIPSISMGTSIQHQWRGSPLLYSDWLNEFPPVSFLSVWRQETSFYMYCYYIERQNFPLSLLFSLFTAKCFSRKSLQQFDEKKNKGICCSYVYLGTCPTTIERTTRSTLNIICTHTSVEFHIGILFICIISFENSIKKFGNGASSSNIL